MQEKTKVESPVVINRSTANHILWKYHNQPLVKHLGWKEIYRAIQSRYYWKATELKRRTT